jgi:hypothetical protein
MLTTFSLCQKNVYYTDVYGEGWIYWRDFDTITVLIFIPNKTKTVSAWMTWNSAKHMKNKGIYGRLLSLWSVTMRRVVWSEAVHSFSSLSHDRSKASSKASSPHSAIYSFLLQIEYPLLSLRSSSSFIRLLPRLPATSIPSCIFPSITCRRRQFLCKMWPIQLAFRFLISCRRSKIKLRRLSPCKWTIVERCVSE